jgi:hypothetical protein
MKSKKPNPNSAKRPDKGEIVNKLYCILSQILLKKHRICMCNKSRICGVLFASGAIAFYEGNNMLSALL